MLLFVVFLSFDKWFCFNSCTKVKSFWCSAAMKSFITIVKTLQYIYSKKRHFTLDIKYTFPLFRSCWQCVAWLSYLALLTITFCTKKPQFFTNWSIVSPKGRTLNLILEFHIHTLVNEIIYHLNAVILKICFRSKIFDKIMKNNS